MRGYTDRTKKLRNESVSTQPRVSLERAIIETEFYEKYFGTVETPVLRALNFKNLMEKRKLYIGDYELIVGEKSEGPQIVPTFPELCCHTIEDMEVMNDRKYISFKVNEEDKKIQLEKIIPYWEKRSTRYKILEAMTSEWKDCYSAGMFTEFMEQRAPGHTVADSKFYEKGFLDFKKEIEEEIEKLDFLNDDDAYDKKAQLEGMAISCDAIIIYGQRYAKYARELASKETNIQRKKELLWIASNCDVVPAHKPETFAQALQMYWFVHIGVTTETNTWDAFSPGKLDQYIYPFYKKEYENKTIDYDKGRELLECLWIKFNNQPAPPKVGITLKESGTYTDFANINTGGINPLNGENGVNDVSYMILDTMDELKLLQPSSNVQISEKNPQEFLKRAVEISRKGWGQPAFYNTEELIQELLNAGKTLEDARFGGSSGCVETGCHGREAYVLTGYLNVPKIFELTMNNGFDKYTNKQIGLKTGNAEDFKSYNELYDAFMKQLDYIINIKIRGNQVIEKIFAKHMPSTFMSVLTTGCKESGKDYNAGGSKYNTRYIQVVGIGTITDCLAAIKYNVFEKKRINMNELLKAINVNFKGCDMIKNLVLNHTPKYGNDDDYADDIMLDIFKNVRDKIRGRKSVCGATYQIDMLPTTCHVYFGSVMTASANGRLAGKPVTDGISPEKGADVNGPTAVIKSCAKMEHTSTGGTLLNQKFTPSSIEGEEGIVNMSSLIRAYFKMMGHHIQFNVVDRSVLLDAQKNPDDYKDLIVRVAGYSDHFNNLEKALQDEIIDRTEQTFN
ncbi:trans-4-hydroxy-L-proline dehydratase [Sedimentibacter sp. MB31-C6]|uniref:trans-4-hydroxy-L-proline dehydratase n=1 Tax=Sedimentibacter sp. MB31-C6 TaxID=3109366 RepID=UPI002DDD4F83|nr:trans-4-hydroxy-L-proline dehydratase [Sedimentibacter sp. MB36-C1]WSI05205.1 trans-4-hydroxy-L-proline dehydratase [Sedimentibacter sp. MB36-C1]